MFKGKTFQQIIIKKTIMIIKFQISTRDTWYMLKPSLSAFPGDKVVVNVVVVVMAVGLNKWTY